MATGRFKSFANTNVVQQKDSSQLFMLPTIVAPVRVFEKKPGFDVIRVLEALVHLAAWGALIGFMVSMNSTIDQWKKASAGTLERAMGEAASPYFVVAMASMGISASLLILVAASEFFIAYQYRKDGEYSMDEHYITFFGNFIQAGLRCVTIFVIISSVLAVDAQDVAHADYRTQSAASIVLAVFLNFHLEGVIHVISKYKDFDHTKPTAVAEIDKLLSGKTQGP